MNNYIYLLNQQEKIIDRTCISDLELGTYWTMGALQKQRIRSMVSTSEREKIYCLIEDQFRSLALQDKKEFVLDFNQFGIPIKLLYTYEMIG
ncbi:hypothetical protein V6R21_25500 [Limibacter armeniacum]|uniref:hypothetical protein n=1 Tax=Limibacter armeniacum TaxID=466084 RepID=UPI002FE54E2B